MARTSNRGPGRGKPPRRPSSRPSASVTPKAHGGSRRPSGGGAARRPAPAAKGGPRFTTRAIVLLSVMVLLIASYTSTLRAWWDQRGEIQQTKAEIAMRTEAIADLEIEKGRWDDAAYVKQQARERFGWVMPGEVGYRVIGSDGTVQGDAPSLDQPPAAVPKQWYDTLWGSVVESGKEPEEAPEDTTDDVLGDE